MGIKREPREYEGITVGVVASRVHTRPVCIQRIICALRGGNIRTLTSFSMDLSMPFLMRPVAMDENPPSKAFDIMPSRRRIKGKKGKGLYRGKGGGRGRKGRKGGKCVIRSSIRALATLQGPLYRDGFSLFSSLLFSSRFLSSLPLSPLSSSHISPPLTSLASRLSALFVPPALPTNPSSASGSMAPICPCSAPINLSTTGFAMLSLICLVTALIPLFTYLFTRGGKGEGEGKRKRKRERRGREEEDTEGARRENRRKERRQRGDREEAEGRS